MRLLNVAKITTVLCSALLMVACASAGANRGGHGSSGDGYGDGSSDSGAAVVNGAGGEDGFGGNANGARGGLLHYNTIYFTYDNDNIQSNGLTPINMSHPDGNTTGATPDQVLQAYGRYLSAHPSAKLRVEGNTDERGTREYNVALGEKRANAVARILESNGASSGQLIIVSYGKERRVSFGDGEDSHCQNRRAHLVLQG